MCWSETVAAVRRAELADVRLFIGELYGPDLHAKRVASLAGATLGVMQAGCRVTILADRGFGDQKLFAFLPKLGFGYVIRFRGNIHVTDADGRTRPGRNGWARAGAPASSPVRA